MHKNGIYFPFDFVGILSMLILSVKNTGGWGFFLLDRQNLLSVTKTICGQSLNH